MNLASTNQRIGKYRWTICALVFFATTINYLDRSVISLLKPYLEKEFGWSETDYANIVVSFQVAYAIGMLAVGRLIDKIGTKFGYALSLFVWSLAAIGHALARSAFGFGVARACLGLSEAGNFPAANKTIAEWFPKKERALATGIYNSGSNVGAISAPLVVPWIAVNWGWQWAFIITGAIGLLWLFFWFVIYDVPAKHKKLGKPEFEYIHSDEDEKNEQAQSQEKVSWLKLLTYKQTWAFFIGKGLTDPIWWFWLFWLPAFLDVQYGLVGMQVTIPLAVVYTMTTFGSVLGGWLPMWFIKNGWDVNRARKTSMFIYALLPIPVLLSQYLGTYNMWFAVVIIGVAASAHQAWSANIFTTVSDMFPKKAVSSVTGIGGMAGAIGGIVIAALAGSLFDAFKLPAISRSFELARARGLGTTVDKLHQLAIDDINKVELRKLKDEFVDQISALDLGSGFESLKAIQQEVVMNEMSKAYLIMFIICGSAYLVSWLIMHFLVPKFNKIEDL
ncbi:MAG: MFS transporter [Deltaproteobacteria bacterium]|nr:MFS transporter [Deltaproteobacteria bacterium]